MLVENGGDLLTLKRREGWRSYKEESIQRKIEENLSGAHRKILISGLIIKYSIFYSLAESMDEGSK